MWRSTNFRLSFVYRRLLPIRRIAPFRQLASWLSVMKRLLGFSKPKTDMQHRNVLLNRLQLRKYRTNGISTAKYNVVTFLPRFLFEQFRRYANIFFLFIVLLQQIPDVSPTGRYTTAIPFIIILTVSALKEIVEDWKRHRADRKTNYSNVAVLRSGQWVTERWDQINVGDIVKVVRDQFFPADLVLLSSSEPQAMAYIETSNLDGETNLKIRQGLPQTANLLNHEDLYACNLSIECEAPNRLLYEFVGNIRCDPTNLPPTSQNVFPLSPDQILLRGARLKNTNWVFGAVIYTGHETKLMMNTNMAPLKRSNVERVVNSQILALFGVLIVVSLTSAIASQIWSAKYHLTAWYLRIEDVSIASFGYNFLTFIILYNNLIPISLQVTLEIVRFFQAVFINSDTEMYYESMDQPALARTSNLNEELGQVKYIFTDKTGTLTRNVMNFKKCTIAGIMYGDNSSDNFDDPGIIQNLKGHHETASIIREFLTLLSVCHTVVPENDSSNEIIYQASSPDEGALVRGAKSIGFVFHTRMPQSVTINVLGADEKYELLNVLEFTSDRKRMSVIVRCPNKQIKLYTKGADTAIYERLSKDQIYADTTIRHLEEFATLGYRTLCLAKVEISEEFYDKWQQIFYDASISLVDREKKLADAADLIEKDFVLLGATAIEDKLQEGVPETIAALLKADIKVWMLTGDKQETAINIGHSCRLLSSSAPFLLLNNNNLSDTRNLIRQYMHDIGSLQSEERDVALIITGQTLLHALHSELRLEFLDLALCCRAVICCRVTPMQKAEVVELVKKHVGAITLAVGDGANDVAMIQAAHVGIGIAGVEGLQAACASDYAIARFRFLQRLLFVHGAWSFHRMVRLILYSFHKNICLYIIELWFAIFSACSGQVVFERWCIGLYNVAFTAGPPLAIGLFDRTASAATMMKYPSLYKLSQNRDSFNVKIFWLYVGNAIYHSILLFWLGKFAFSNGIVWSVGKEGGLFLMGNAIYTYVVVVVCLKAGIELDAWTWLCHLAIWGSIGLWLLFVVVYSNVWPLLPIGPEMAGMAHMLFSSPIFWTGLIFIPIATLFIDFVYKVIRRTLFKTIADEVRELELAHLDPSVILPKLNRNSWWFWRNQPYDMTSGDTTNQHGLRWLPSTDSTSTGYSLETTTTTLSGSENGSSSNASGLIMNRLSETARLLRHAISFKRTASSAGVARDAKHGYAFSQDEDGVVTQSQIVRAYDSTRPKPFGQ